MIKAVNAIPDRIIGDDGIDPIEDIQLLITVQYGDSGIKVLHAVASNFAITGITLENGYADRAAPGNPRVIIIG